MQCLIDQVRAEIEPDSAARLGALPPAIAHDRADSGHNRDSKWTISPSVPCIHQAPHRQEIAVPAAVCEMPRASALQRWAISTNSSASATVVVMGLSTITCLPAAKARFARSKCVELGVAITIRSKRHPRRPPRECGTTTTSGQSAWTFAASLDTTCVRFSPSTLAMRRGVKGLASVAVSD